MKLDLKSLIIFDELCSAYDYKIGSNQKMVEILETFAQSSFTSFPKEFFDGMRILDRKHFVVSQDELVRYAGEKLNLTEEKIRSDNIIMDAADSLPYNISDKLAIEKSRKHFTNDITTDLMTYMLLEISKDDDVCEIPSSNGYMAAIIGMNCRSVTSFDLVKDLNGLASRNISSAGYSKGNINFVEDVPPYRKTIKNLDNSFSKIYTNAAISKSQYYDTKKLLREKGRMVALVQENNKLSLVYHDGRDKILFEMKGKYFLLENDSNLN